MRMIALLIDPHPFHAKILGTILRSFDWSSVAVATGREGLSAALSLSPELIILDADLPDLNAIGLIVDLRRHWETVKIPIIVTAGNRGPLLERRCREAGADIYLEKPVRADALMTAVKQAV